MSEEVIKKLLDLGVKFIYIYGFVYIIRYNLFSYFISVSYRVLRIGSYVIINFAYIEGRNYVLFMFVYSRC